MIGKSRAAEKHHVYLGYNNRFGCKQLILTNYDIKAAFFQ